MQTLHNGIDSNYATLLYAELSCSKMHKELLEEIQRTLLTGLEIERHRGTHVLITSCYFEDLLLLMSKWNAVGYMRITHLLSYVLHKICSLASSVKSVDHFVFLFCWADSCENMQHSVDF